VGHHGPLVGPVGVGRQEHDRRTARLGRLLGPAPRIERAVGGHAGHHGEPAGHLTGHGDRGQHDLGPLTGRQGLVLAERSVRHHPVAAVGGQEAQMVGVRPKIDAEVVAQG
jgi:hypothetical protein